MPVVRVNKTRDYTVMSNVHLKDKRLSLKAKGLLSIMLSLPDDWDYTIAGLAKISLDGETAINAALRELKKTGYLVVEKIMPGKSESGRIEYEYTVFETPEQGGKKQGLEKQGVEIQAVEIQAVENQGQLNTYHKILNNQILNNQLLSEGGGVKLPRFVPPSVEEVEEYCKIRGNSIDAEHFVNYYQQSGWKLSTGVAMKDWKAAVRNWEQKPWNKTKKQNHELDGVF
jgi:hypothetical protein